MTELGWSAPWLLISAVTHSGTEELMQRVSAELELIAEAEQLKSPPADDLEE